MFDKRCILFGSEGSAKSFSSDTTPESIVPQTGLPTAVVEAVDPIVLDTRIVEDCTAAGVCEGNVSEIPAAIEAVFASPIVLEPVGTAPIFCDPGAVLLGAAGARARSCLSRPTTTASPNRTATAATRRIPAGCSKM
ncbi:MAG: hypothetical protein ACLUNQ_05050 [Oscillospiraceae bacterium]